MDVLTCSVPVLDEAVPAGGRHFGGFVRVPQRSDADVVVRLELLEQLRRLPVPHETTTVGVARDEITTKFDPFYTFWVNRARS